MDFTYALWVSSILFWMFSTMIEANSLAHDRPPRLKNKKTNARSSPKSKKSSSSPSSLLSSSSSSKRSKSSRRKCCDNGGVCVMDVFCHCPKNFYGFRCQYEMKQCGPIEHMSWARVGCNMCRCYDSQLYCIPRVYDGCDDQPLKEDIKVSDYEDSEIHIFPPDDTTIDPLYADYYDQYHGGYSDGESIPPNDKPSSSGAPKAHFAIYVLLVLLAVCLSHCNHFTITKGSFR